ncbi:MULTISPECIES: desulfoferrodoxin family protein [Eubacteriales]
MIMKFYRCEHCGNIITFVHSAGVPVMCCGQKMTELVPGTTDGAAEKHVPVVEVQGSTVQVKVGSVEHPMLPEHFIQFIAIETKHGSQIKYLQPGEKPQASFVLADGDQLVAAYEYCNLHGLWKA